MAAATTVKLSSKDRAKDTRLRTIYNTTLEAQNAERTKQRNACAICRRPFNQFMSFQDHDHKCCPRRLHRFCGLCNRGILCYLCNKYAVGLIEWLRKMDIGLDEVVAYVKKWDAEIVRKGGYAPKAAAKSKTKSRRKQKGVRRSSKSRPASGSSLVITKPRSQP